jgi:hypothetical protein
MRPRMLCTCASSRTASLTGVCAGTSNRNCSCSDSCGLGERGQRAAWAGAPRAGAALRESARTFMCSRTILAGRARDPGRRCSPSRAERCARGGRLAACGCGLGAADRRARVGCRSRRGAAVIAARSRAKSRRLTGTPGRGRQAGDRSRARRCSQAAIAAGATRGPSGDCWSRKPGCCTAVAARRVAAEPALPPRLMHRHWDGAVTQPGDRARAASRCRHESGFVAATALPQHHSLI